MRSLTREKGVFNTSFRRNTEKERALNVSPPHSPLLRVTNRPRARARSNSNALEVSPVVDVRRQHVLLHQLHRPSPTLRAERVIQTRRRHHASFHIRHRCSSWNHTRSVSLRALHVLKFFKNIQTRSKRKPCAVNFVAPRPRASVSAHFKSSLFVFFPCFSLFLLADVPRSSSRRRFAATSLFPLAAPSFAFLSLADAAPPRLVRSMRGIFETFDFVRA